MSHSIGGQKVKRPYRYKGFIKRRQSVTVTLGSGQTSNTATLPIAVDKNKSRISKDGFRGSSGGNANRDYYQIRVELTNNNTVTAYVNTSDTVDRIITATVIEYFPWVIKGNVEHGTISGTDTNTTATATPGFTPSVEKNTLCFWTGFTTDESTQFLDDTSVALEYDFGGNEITSLRAGSDGAWTMGYCFMEFNEGYIRSKIDTFVTISSGNASGTAAVSTVTMPKTTVFGNGFTATGNFQEDIPLVYLSSSAQLTAQRYATTATTIKYYVTVVEWHADAVKKVSRGVHTFGVSETDHDETVTKFNPTTTFVSFLGHYFQNGFANLEYNFAHLKLVDANKVRATKTLSNTGAGSPIDGYTRCTFSWEVVECV